MMHTYSLGLDMGTTSISAVVLDLDGGHVVESRTEKSLADILPDCPGGKCQDPDRMIRLAGKLLEDLLGRYPRIKCIGITGQMHGIVYLDKAGNPVSPLYTWQDQRSAHLCPRLSALTGCRIAPGYGLATHCAMAEAGTLPPEGVRVCTIMDYLAFLLCGKENLLMHASNAASLGFYSLKEGCFDAAALKKVGIREDLLPPITGKTQILGYYRGIPVAVAIGDNQASFLGTVSQPDTTALVNFGTGSQISRMVRSLPEQWEEGAVEARPYLEGTYLLCGSALCGGRAYALLEGFFRRFLAGFGVETENCYEVLNRLAGEGLTHPAGLQVETTFCGTRLDPDKRGSITNLGEENFTPEALAAGVLLGMAEELKKLLDRMPGGPLQSLAASGNAVRSNPGLLQAVNRVFGLETRISSCREEAASGAARFGAMAAGFSEA